MTDLIDSRIQELREQITALRIDLENAQTDVVSKNRELGRAKRRIRELEGEGVLPADVLKVVDFWKDHLHHHGAKVPLAGERARKVRARLRDGFTVEDLKQAIIGCGRSSWHQGDNPQGRKYDDLTKICESEKTVEDFAKLADKPALDPHARARYWHGVARDEKQTNKSLREWVASPRQRPIAVVLDALSARNLDWRPSTTQNDTWQAQCPAHDDRSPSLIVTEAENRAALIYCYAGCQADEVLRELGLTFGDIAPRPDPLDFAKSPE